MTDQPEPRDLTPTEIAQMSVMERLSLFDGLGIGLCGAHRTGKTSLCEALSAKNAFLPFVRTSAKEAAQKFGFDVDNPGSFADRMGWQEYLLEQFAATYEQQDGIFIADRTPLDMAAYMLADAPLGEIDPELDKRVQAYLKRCKELTERHFTALVLIQPGIQHVPAPGSPAPNRAYQEKLNALMLGIGWDYDRPLSAIPREVTDFDARLNIIATTISKSIAGYKVLLSHLPKQ